MKWHVQVCCYLGYRLKPWLLLRTRDKPDCILFWVQPIMKWNENQNQGKKSTIELYLCWGNWWFTVDGVLLVAVALKINSEFPSTKVDVPELSHLQIAMMIDGATFARSCHVESNSRASMARPLSPFVLSYSSFDRHHARFGLKWSALYGACDPRNTPNKLNRF